MNKFISILLWGLSACIAAAHGSDHTAQEASDGTLAVSSFECAEHPGFKRHCSPVFACIGNEGEYFQGRARGRGDIGLVRGRTGSGAHCSGFWQRDAASGEGQSKLNCSDGMRAEVRWDVRDSTSGYFVGTGKDSQNRAVLFWVGQSYIDRIRRENLDPQKFCMSYLEHERFDWGHSTKAAISRSDMPKMD